MSFLPTKPTFGTITLSSLTGTEGSTFTATVSGRTSNTLLELVGFNKGNFTLSGNTLTGINLKPGSIKLTLREYSFDSAYSYRKETDFTLTIAESNKSPINLYRPSLTGESIVKGVLTVNVGEWTGYPSSLTYTYQWTRSGIDISGATSSTYTLVNDDKGQNIRCRVTATNSTGSTSAISVGTPYIGNAKFVVTQKVYILTGDSNGAGAALAADRQAAADAYVVSNKIKVLNSTGAWVDYNPATGITGVGAWVNADNASIGSEIGFIEQWKANKPTETLYLMKRTCPGAFEGRVEPSLGTITGSISGNVLTTTGGTPAINRLLAGSGIPAGHYISTGSGTNWFIKKLGMPNSFLPNLTVASTSISMYGGISGTYSWGEDTGYIWRGKSGLFSTVDWLIAGLASLENPEIIGVYHSTGGNDADVNASSTAYGAADLAHMASARSLLPLADVKWIRPRTPGATSNPSAGSPFASAVRTSMINNMNTDPLYYPINMDLSRGAEYITHDGTHFPIAGLRAAGVEAYNILFNGAKGLRP